MISSASSGTLPPLAIVLGNNQEYIKNRGRVYRRRYRRCIAGDTSAHLFKPARFCPSGRANLRPRAGWLREWGRLK